MGNRMSAPEDDTVPEDVMKFFQMCEHGEIPGLGDHASGFTGSKKKLPPYIMVAAIDFGTTYSGYAFAMKDSKDKIQMNKNWGAEFGCTSYKTPTSVLVDPDKKFRSFGYEAQQQYAELMEKEDQEFLYFERFKMALHKTKDLGKSTTINAANGKSMQALTVFGMALEYLKNHLVDTVNKTIEGTLDEAMIRWVITVPAIWSDASKQFMREAALKGGLIKEINSDHLLIALEPEAASLYVRKMDISNDASTNSIKCGTKYLVIDAGGGTLDITAHELRTDGNIKEVHFATGGDYGGSKVDEQFGRLLADIFSSKFIKGYKRKRASQWLQLLIDFEKRKKNCKKNNPGGLNVSIPWSFAASLQEFSNRDVVKVVKEYRAGGVSLDNGMLRLDGNVVTSLFKPVTDGIVKHIQDLLKNPKLKDVEYLFCVGGFNESIFLQEVIQEAFGEKYKILIPEEASLAVLKGAILFGQNPDVISSRISAKTYGVNIAMDFIPFLHDRSRVIVIDGRPLCFGMFNTFVRKGQEVPDGFSCTKEFGPSVANGNHANIGIYTSENVNPRYVTDSDVEKHGEVSVKWPGYGLDRTVEVTMTFGGTEVKLEAVTYPKKHKAETKISFLAE